MIALAATVGTSRLDTVTRLLGASMNSRLDRKSSKNLHLFRIVLLTVVLVAVGANGNTGASEWSLEKHEDGIDIYTRSVPDSGIKEFKGTVEVEASLDTVHRLLRDADGFKNWFPNTPESKLLSRENNISYQYSVMDAPWPVSDRDNIFRSVTVRNEQTGAVEIQTSAAPDYYPEQPDRVRVQQAKGSWMLEPLGASSTRVTFRMHLDPGGGVPQWLINARVVASPLQALTNLRATVGD